jgi:prevent-host-death family protein
MQNVQNKTILEKAESLMEKALGVTEARKKFSSIVEEVQYQGYIYLISRYGKPAAAVVPVEVYENWQRQREEFFDLIRNMQREADLSLEEADQVATEAVAAIRAQT